MRKRREINVFSISFLDLLSGALGAVIILFVAIPKGHDPAVEKQGQFEQLELELAVVKARNSKLVSENSDLKKSKETQAIDQAMTVEEQPVKSVAAQDFDIGFKFKGKSVVFMIDTSYSMTEEDRIGQVKAGLKMLLTALTPNYKVEVVQFPFSERAPYRAMWGELREAGRINKLDAFDFIYTLRPQGGTPTRDALAYVLRNYPKASDIVLLSDGAPSLHNSNKKDDIYDILKMAREHNAYHIQINTIGVGPNFIQDKTSQQYQFLSLLAEQSGGFFVGF